MKIHSFFHVVLHFLLSAVDVPPVRSYPSGQIGSTPEGVVKRVYGDDYGPVSTGSLVYRTCDHDGYFSPEHWEESGAAEAYLKWSILVNKTSEAWLERESEPNFFLRHVLNWSDLDCGITYKGCIGMPTCDEILTRTQNETTARRIYFIVLSMNNFNLVSGVVNEQSVPAQVNVASMVANMANTFFWKHSDEVDRKCRLKINALKALLAAFLAAPFVATPFLGPGTALAKTALEAEEMATKAEGAALDAALGAAKAATAAEAAGAAAKAAGVTAEVAEVAEAAGAAEAAEVAEAAKAAEAAVANEAAAVKEAQELGRDAEEAKMEAIVHRTEATRTLKEVEKKDAHKYMAKPGPWTFAKYVKGGKKFAKKFGTNQYAVTASSFGNVPMFHIALTLAAQIGGNDVESKFCAKYPNPPKEAQHAHEMELDTDIRKAAINFREEVQSDVTLINTGVGFGENGTFTPFGNTVLSDQLFSGYYVKLSPIDHMRFVKEPSRIEADITNHFKNALISSMLKEELCFLHCTRKDSSYELKMESSQFEPVPGTLCQTQCWRNWKKGENVELYGLHDLIQPDNNWNLALQDFVSGSFKHWQDHRFDQRDENLFPTVGEILSMQATSSSGSFLPVCYSELMPPVDMHDKDEVHDLPCVCGNDRGNETKLFFKEAGFDNWVGNQDGHGVAVACQGEMSNKEIPPVTGYLELCDNGWHFPLDYEHGDLQKGADEQCDQVRSLQASLLEQGHDTRHINCRICFDTPVGAQIMANQKNKIKGNVYRFRKVFTFWRACNEYDRNPETSCLY